MATLIVMMFHVHRIIIMLIIIAVYLIGGSFIEDLAFLILATPIFLPIALTLGYDPVWFGVIVCVVTMIGIIIPPMAISAFVVSGVTGRTYRQCVQGHLSVLGGNVPLSPYVLAFSGDFFVASESAYEVVTSLGLRPPTYDVHTKI